MVRLLARHASPYTEAVLSPADRPEIEPEAPGPDLARAFLAPGPVRRRGGRIPRRHLLLQVLALIAVIWTLVRLGWGGKGPAPAQGAAAPFVVSITAEEPPAPEADPAPQH